MPKQKKPRTTTIPIPQPLDLHEIWIIEAYRALAPSGQRAIIKCLVALLPSNPLTRGGMVQALQGAVDSLMERLDQTIANKAAQR